MASSASMSSVAAETAHAVDATPTAAPTLLFEGAPVAGEWVVDDLTLADAERYEATFVAAIAAAVDVDERAVSVHFSEHFHEDHRRALEEEEASTVLVEYEVRVRDADRDRAFAAAAALDADDVDALLLAHADDEAYAAFYYARTARALALCRAANRPSTVKTSELV